MTSVIQKMINRYPDQSLKGRNQALREVIQEVALVGLWRGKFFEHAAFYGGTALRILYGLDRFSEDMDFTLISPNEDFSWQVYERALVTELEAFGLEVSFAEKRKTQDTAVHSAFLKGNTLQEMMKIGVPSSVLKGVHPETKLKIKVEVDTQPPLSFPTETIMLSDPAPVSIRCVTLEGLFAGKMHAALFRAWRGRVKGRDWFDLIWYIRRNQPLNLKIFSLLMGKSTPLSPSEFTELAKAKIDSLDVESAISDILAFISDPEVIKREWSKEYFHQWLARLQFSW